MTPTPAWAAIDGGTITAEVDRRLTHQRLYPLAAAVLTPDAPDLPAEEAPVNRIRRAWRWIADSPIGLCWWPKNRIDEESR